MTDASCLRKSRGKEDLDPTAGKRGFHCANQRFPSYFRSLRNFCEGLVGIDQAKEAVIPAQRVTHFPSMAAHVAIV